jgi:coenzyme Q-binding protein COQ10
MERPNRDHVEYLDGPLKYLRNDWLFRPAPGGCDVEFTVDFAFKNRVFEMLAGQMFGLALKQMIRAFETRAAQLYGAGGASGSSSSSAHSAA